MPHRPHPSPHHAPAGASRGHFSQLVHDGGQAGAMAALQRDPQALLYAGLGLAGRAFSEGLAVDVLAIIALVEHLRRQSARKQATLLIADTNAIAAGYPASLVQPRAAEYFRQTKALCQALGSSIQVQMASSWELLAEHVPLPAHVQRTAPYVRIQIGQMIALFAHGYRIKIGWRMPGAKRDEMHFDELYHSTTEAGPDTPCLQTIYGLAGRSFDPSYPRSCPYISYADRPRILLRDPTSVRDQIARGLVHAQAPTRGYRRHLIKIARGIRPLVDPTLAKMPALDLLEVLRRATW